MEGSGLYDRAVEGVEDVSCRRWRSSPNEGPLVDAAGFPTGSGWDPGVGKGAGGGGGLWNCGVAGTIITGRDVVVVVEVVDGVVLDGVVGDSAMHW